MMCRAVTAVRPDRHPGLCCVSDNPANRALPRPRRWRTSAHRTSPPSPPARLSGCCSPTRGPSGQAAEAGPIVLMSFARARGSYVVKGCLRSPPPSRWSVLRAWQMRSDRRSLRARMASRLVLPVSRAGTEQTLTYTYSPRPTTAAWSAASTRPTSRASMSALPSCRVLSRPATGRAGPCGLCLGSFPGRPVPRLATAAY